MLYLITGRAGAGKTTRAIEIADSWWFRYSGQRCVIIDGDDVRLLWNDGDYSDVGREKHAVRMTRIAVLVEKQGLTPIIAAVTPTRRIRDLIRSYFEESKLIYMEGGKLWPGTTYEEPTEEEINV